MLEHQALEEMSRAETVQISSVAGRNKMEIKEAEEETEKRKRGWKKGRNDEGKGDEGGKDEKGEEKGRDTKEKEEDKEEEQHTVFNPKLRSPECLSRCCDS